MYEYTATVERVLDADTIDADVDLGFSVHRKERLRLFGLNAPEKGTVEGREATEWLKAQLPIGSQITIRTQKDKTEKFGRMLATIILPNNVDLNAQLIELGLAVSWDGKGQRPVPNGVNNPTPTST